MKGSQLCERDSQMSAWRVASVCFPWWGEYVVNEMINIWNKLLEESIDEFKKHLDLFLGKGNWWVWESRRVVLASANKVVTLRKMWFFPFAQFLHFYVPSISILKNIPPTPKSLFLTNNFFSTLSSKGSD